LELAELVVGPLQLLGELDRLAVADPRRLLEVGGPLRALRLVARLLDPLLQLPDPADDLLLALPARAQGAPLLDQRRQLLLERLKPLAGGLVGLLLQRLAL